MTRTRNRRGYSLLEILAGVLLVVIVAALVVPRLSRGATASGDGEVRERLRLLRSAIELYYLDHGKYPGQAGDGVNAAGTAEAFVRQLTGYTDKRGLVAQGKDALHRFGPYLRTGVPVCPVAPRMGMTGVAAVKTAPRFVSTPMEIGWVYNCQTGDIAVNSDAVDPHGTAYDRY